MQIREENARSVQARHLDVCVFQFYLWGIFLDYIQMIWIETKIFPNIYKQFLNLETLSKHFIR